MTVNKKAPKKDIKKETPTLSPAEVWKNAAKLIEYKNQKVDKTEKPSLTEFNNSLKEIRKKKIEDIGNKVDYYKKEITASIRFFTDFEKIKRKDYERITVPEYFPVKNLDTFEGPDIYKKLDTDTLFYIFYYHPNTIRQYFAARELKRYAWRFNTKYKTWFQRLAEPTLITEHYEKGSFAYFDYETKWQTRQKDNFIFEYKYLEDFI